MSDIEDRYFNLLVRFIGGSFDPDLLGQLHNIPFMWVVPNDVNRMEDGRDLRIQLLHDLDATEHDITMVDEEDVSVLEVLAALAERVLFQYEELSIEGWFEKFLDNLGLVGLPEGTKSFVVDDIIHDWMSRNIDPDGGGGLFPLNKPPTDQRHVEIWYQMSAYVIEIMEVEGFFD